MPAIAVTMSRVACVLVAAVLAAGCSPAQKQALRERYNLVPPTIITGAGIDGQRVTLDRFQALVVRLDEDPNYGQRWQMQPLRSHVLVAPVQHDYVASPGTDPAAPNMPGQAVFRFRGVAPGAESVVLEFKRPDEPASRTIRFDVAVR